MTEQSEQPVDTLAQVLAAKGALNLHDALGIGLRLVHSIGRLHAAGRIHRCICADSVGVDGTLLEPEPVVQIGGLGESSIPCPPAFCGRPVFLLPSESAEASAALVQNSILLDPRQIDFYQAGALLCQMVSGHPVTEYLRSCQAKADTPVSVRPLIDRALGLNKNECFACAEEFALAIEAVLSNTSDSAAEPAPLPTAHDPVPFKTLGHYEILGLIGHGGMGDVFKGYDRNLDRLAAIKVLPEAMSRQKEFVRRFHAEAAAMARIDHPNIVRVYYSGQDQGRHFFAMQYVEGQSLADLLAREKVLGVPSALSIARQCLSAIAAAHQHGLIHRDIKPGNVLLDSRSQRALVTDFGVAKSLYADTQMTVTGTVMGTADYIAPEQARGGSVDGRADLYAMGVLMYQMLSGKLPFEAASATSMMFQHAYQPPPPLSEAAPDVPAHIVQIVMKLMAKDPAQRYQTAEEVITALSPEDTSASLPYQSPQTTFFDGTPQTSPTLSGLVAKTRTIRNRLICLRNRILGLLGFVAPQLAASLQTTCQQVDGAVDEYQQRRNTLQNLANEAQAMAVDLQMKANACKKAAQAAVAHLETETDQTARQKLLEEKQDNEQSAAELAQLAAEQQQQAQEIKQRLDSVDATLAQLVAQRDALNARLKLANAHHRAEGGRPHKQPIKRKLVYAAAVGFVVLAVLFVSVSRQVKIIDNPDIIQSSGIDPHLLGVWKSVDFVKTIDTFHPNQRQWPGELFLKDLTFFENGTTSGPWYWKNGGLYHPGDNTYAQCIIKILDGTPYLFMEWMSGDVTLRGQQPSYYVMKKQSSSTQTVGLPIIYCEGISACDIIINDPQSTADFVISKIGQPQERRFDGRQLVYHNDTLRFGFFSENGTLSEVHLNRGFQGKLATGITLDSSKQDVFDIYGEPIATIQKPSLNRVNIESTLCVHEWDPQTSRIYYGKHGLIFWFQGDTIKQIVPFKGRVISTSSN